MSANGATREMLRRAIREKDEEIVRLLHEIAAKDVEVANLGDMVRLLNKANTDLLVEAGYIA